MPRLLDARLERVLRRANPNVRTIVEISTPDVSNVLRRAVDQFLVNPPRVSETPGGSSGADASGMFTLASTPANLFAFAADSTDVPLAPPNSSTKLVGLSWDMSAALGPVRLRSFSALLSRSTYVATNQVGINLTLQIYRVTSQTITAISPQSGQPFQIANTVFVPLLASPVALNSNNLAWPGSGTQHATATWDLGPTGLIIDPSTAASAVQTASAPPASFLFVVSADVSMSGMIGWLRDTTTSRTVAGVGTFSDDEWTSIATPGRPPLWNLATTARAPVCTLAIESFAATTACVFALAMADQHGNARAPSSGTTGRVVFQRSAPKGTTCTLELSTAGSGGPWTGVEDGFVVATAQATYHLRATLQSDATHHAAPAIAAMGVEFRTPVDVSLESIVAPLQPSIAVPYLAAAVGQGSIGIVRTGQRDYADTGTALAIGAPVSQLEVDLLLGSDHPDVPRDAWLRLERSLVTQRQPAPSKEQFGTLSYLKTLHRKIPARVETLAGVYVVDAGTTDSAVKVTSDLEGTTTSGNEYDGQNYYLRVRASSQTGVSTGFLATIGGNTAKRQLDFGPFSTAGLPGTLIAGDVIEVHSGQYLQPALTYVDQDPADVWWDILTNYLLIPPDRIGHAGFGRAGRAGLPPTVTDRSSDVPTQAKLKVTLGINDAEYGDALLDQLSFLMGGATIEVEGQIVFRQIYPLRDSDGTVTVPPEPIAAVLDVRTLINLQTPIGLEQRIPSLACNYGVDTTATAKDAPAPNSAVYVDADALNYLDDQGLSDDANATIATDIARWCFNSADGGLLLASLACQQVVRGCSTGLRLWSFGNTEQLPELVIGDRVVIITDQVTDYDPSVGRAVRGVWAFALVIVDVGQSGRTFKAFMADGLADAIQIRGGPGALAAQRVVGVQLLVTATFVSRTSTTDRYAVTVIDPIGGAAVALDVASGGTVTVTRVGGPPLDTSFPGDPAGTTVQYDVVRPVQGEGTARVVFIATAPTRLQGTDALDVPERAAVALLLTVQPIGASDPPNRYAFQVAADDPFPQGAGSITLTLDVQGSLAVYDFGTSTGPTVGAIDPGSMHAFEGVRQAIPLTVVISISAAGRVLASAAITIPELSGSSGGVGGFAFDVFTVSAPNYSLGQIPMNIQFANNASTVRILRRQTGSGGAWIDDGITLPSSDPLYTYAWPAGTLDNVHPTNDEFWDFKCQDDTTLTDSPTQTIEVQYR